MDSSKHQKIPKGSRAVAHSWTQLPGALGGVPLPGWKTARIPFTRLSVSGRVAHAQCHGRNPHHDTLAASGDEAGGGALGSCKTWS